MGLNCYSQLVFAGNGIDSCPLHSLQATPQRSSKFIQSWVWLDTVLLYT